MKRAVALGAVVAVALAGLSGCASGPVDRRALCTGFDELGRTLMTAVGGIFDNAVFSSADDLSDLAERYSGADLSADAAALGKIADSDETSGTELQRATRQTATVCGHPLGLGTTSYADTGSTSAGGYGSYGGGYSAPTTSYTEPTTTQYAEPPTSTEPTTAADNAPADEAAAQTTLRQQVGTDRTRAEALADRWVPQLSSKNDGLVADGTTYDQRAIWADFTTTRQSYPSALLLWSGDYTSFTKGDFWITVVNTPFTTGAAANDWCTAEHLDADHCFAKLISHTHGPKGSTLPR
ncbi:MULTISPECIES: hypothetical protein [unclassified Amycolatopsis]|uniref:hypothetical protein n=1 Tax=unclassified Amycolatopsis TaxID=2618356 RepID=UPI002E1F91F4|nr:MULTISPECIES: hypothetical protein [unclassified Amycolatopsis]